MPHSLMPRWPLVQGPAAQCEERENGKPPEKNWGERRRGLGMPLLGTGGRIGDQEGVRVGSL